MVEHHVDFSFSAPYYTLNELTSETTNLWIVCPGYGQLAKHFIRRFDVFDSSHFVIALQGLSKFYLPGHTKVGASWMTKEDRENEMGNQKNYFDAVIQQACQGQTIDHLSIHLMGFSQGVSMIARMAAYAKINFNQMVLWAGGFPPELSSEDFDFLSAEAKLSIVLGKEDEFFRLDKNFQSEIDKAEKALNRKADLVMFDGKHEVRREVLKRVFLGLPT